MNKILFVGYILHVLLRIIDLVSSESLVLCSLLFDPCECAVFTNAAICIQLGWKDLAVKLSEREEGYTVTCRDSPVPPSQKLVDFFLFLWIIKQFQNWSVESLWIGDCISPRKYRGWWQSKASSLYWRRVLDVALNEVMLLVQLWTGSRMWASSLNMGRIMKDIGLVHFLWNRWATLKFF